MLYSERKHIAATLLLNSALVAWPAAAQTQTRAVDPATKAADAEAGRSDEIVVTGSRASQRSAAKAKRDAAVILDAVS